ncbi:MAG: carbohydrate binding domain-containing protein [bacterium]
MVLWLGKNLKKALVSLVLAATVVWAVHWAVLDRAVENQDYGGRERRGALEHFAGAQYDFGMQAWYENRLEEAQSLFGEAVSVNPLYINAWLRLAEVRQVEGEVEKAKEILLFTDLLAGDVVKWKWRQLLMARQLGMEEMFVENINFVIPFYQLRDQALELVDTHYGGQTERVLERLETKNLSDYLGWLMQRGRVKDSLAAWKFLNEKREVDRELYERYIRFLVRNKEIPAAVRIREAYTGLKDEMANPGFEEPMSGNVFGWQAWSRDFWDIRRDRYEKHEGDYSLKVEFSGKENINFHHVRQYAPVEPGNTYKLVFWWKSSRLTTDKLPFVEVRGVDCKNAHWKTEMIAPDSDWHEQSLTFEPGDDCNAVMIRLRRHKSHRFDSDIDGAVWIDKFRLKSE